MLCCPYQEYLDALLCEVLAGATAGDISHDEPGADGLKSAVLCCDATRAFGGHVQVVSNGPRRHLQHVVGGALVREDVAQSGEERARRTAAQKLTN